ncbi:hypothetical protein [Spirosoma endophyticum]|uniref:Beta-xylosidase C-terminal Concanavalin A-like domain-containing protein n=1 Tax=Spirosoma endophyticum TaxID=662367 RepID=A0A1I1VFI8_9BACT|nr:hypothetical protein [Spirosoma endophyticum]SFD81639.1 hypothetical protein SAMN05216167_107159 [Spirosoma endophyticum]
MDDFDRRAFADLFKAVVIKCFGHPLSEPLSEPESKHLSNEIEERTGLVIGWKSVKNYAAYVLNPASSKQENPSIATLDTLARYVLDAPATSEVERKKVDEHFPYWFRYREQVGPLPKPDVRQNNQTQSRLRVISAGLVVAGLIGLFLFFRQSDLAQLQEDFHTTDESYLKQNGWFLQDKNAQFWNRRAEKSNRLTLFTLKGDNWPKTGEAPRVQNLLLKEIQDDCFYTEIHFNDFVPDSNWQQAGLLLLEDTLFTGKSIRLSLSYNNYFGGYVKPGEILIQAIAAYGKGHANLEEFVHQPLFQLANANDQRIARTNLKNFAFRIEKQGQKFRFLYSASPVDNFSFKEVTTHEFGMTPKYIGLFALKGFVDTTTAMPVTVRYFRLDGQRCE